MKKRLYCVSLETEVYVYAESKEKAERVADASIRELDEGDFYCQATLAIKCGLRPEWEDVPPFTESRYEDPPDCKEIYNVEKNAEDAAKRQLNLNLQVK